MFHSTKSSREIKQDKQHDFFIAKCIVSFIQESELRWVVEMGRGDGSVQEKLTDGKQKHAPKPWKGIKDSQWGNRNYMIRGHLRLF